MALYVASVTVTSQATAPYVVCALRGATGGRTRVRGIEVFCKTAPTTSLGLTIARSTTQGTGTMTGVVGLPNDPAESATGTGIVGTAWATARPVIGAASTYGRRAILAPAIGSGVMWDWDVLKPYIVPTSAAATADLCLVQTTATASGDLEITFEWDE